MILYPRSTVRTNEDDDLFRDKIIRGLSNKKSMDKTNRRRLCFVRCDESRDQVFERVSLVLEKWEAEK